MPINTDTRLVPIPGIPHLQLVSPLGLLAPLPGKWAGTGFNQIWRPFHGPGSDNFLELNLTSETLEFSDIGGEIPNRGLVQDDISLFGMTYLQQVADAVVKDTSGNPAGIHIEPGIWVNVPLTTDPGEPATVARMANIPHGTSLLAQGTAQVFPGPPQFAPVDITPFFIGAPGNLVPFPSQQLGNVSAFRSAPADIVGVTQAMVDNPNSVLAAALVGRTIHSTTVIRISTRAGQNTAPAVGGGVSDIAFLDGAAAPNARVDGMEATFWISDFTNDADGTVGTLLQYSQVVVLNFAPLSWPHVSVANLVKQGVTKAPIKDIVDHKHLVKDKIEIKEHKVEIKEVKVEIKEHKAEIKELKHELELPFPQNPLPGPGPVELPQGGPVGPGGPAGPATPAPSFGQAFIAPAERPTVGGQSGGAGAAGPAGPAAAAPSSPAAAPAPATAPAAPAEKAGPQEDGPREA